MDLCLSFEAWTVLSMHSYAYLVARRDGNDTQVYEEGMMLIVVEMWFGIKILRGCIKVSSTVHKNLYPQQESKRVILCYHHNEKETVRKMWGRIPQIKNLINQVLWGVIDKLQYG